MNDVLAFDIGGTHLRVATVNSENAIGEILTEDIRTLPFTEIYERVVRLASEYVNNGTISAVGIAAAGQVDSEAGTVAYHAVADATSTGGNWKFQKIAIVDQVSQSTGLPVIIENDGNAIALAEWQAGAAQGYDNVVSFNLGTYPGSGVVMNGQLLRRKYSGILIGAAVSETLRGIGYLSDGISGHGMSERLKELCSSKPDSDIAQGWDHTNQAGKYIFERAKQDDPDALAIFDEASKSLGMLLATTMNMFEPDIITLGGRVMDAYAFLQAGSQEIVQKYALPRGSNEACQITTADFQYTGGLIGAAIAARRL